MKYLALGDGFCAGNGVSFLTPNLIQRHARFAEEELKERVYVTTVARSNYRSKDILRLLDDEYVIERIKESNMIVLSAAHQDFLEAMKAFKNDENEKTFHESLKMCKSNVDDIVNRVKEMKTKQDDPYMLSILGLHNPYHDHLHAEKWVKYYNRHLGCRASTAHINAVNLHNHFNGNLEPWCTNDFLYPNRDGHHEVALKLHEIGYKPLVGENILLIK